MSATLKPRFDPFLWAQLRPSVTSARQAGGEDANQTFFARNVPLVPENQIATSLRVVLHDTKSMMEQFSDKLGNLLSGVDQAKRQIDKVNDSFETGQEKILEELVATVNRCQKGLLEVIDTPAQAPVLNEVNLCQTETFEKLGQLETRVDLLHNTLQTVSEQQSQIMTCLAGITPLVDPLRDIPQQLHHMISSFSTLQPLFQDVPDQIKLIFNETSAQNVQALQTSLAVSTSMEKHLESLNRIVSDSTKLITAIGDISRNPQESVISHHSITRTHSQASSGVLPSCDANASMPPGQNMIVSQTSKGVKRSWRDRDNTPHSNMTFESQNRQDETNMDATFGKFGTVTSHSSVPRGTRNKGVSKRPRLPLLAKATAPAQKQISNCATSGKKQGRPRKIVPCSVASLPDKTGVLVEKRVAHATSASIAPPAKNTSTRVLRSRIPHLTIPNSSTKDDTIAPISKETSASSQSINKPLVPSHIQIPCHSSVLPTPLSIGRRTLLPPFPDGDQDIDIELDWGEIGRI